MEKLLARIDAELGPLLRTGIPQGFNHLTILLDGRKKPITLFNSQRIIGFTGEKVTGIVLRYSAGPDNVHDKAVFNALNDSGIFRSYRSSLFGLRGTTFERYFLPDRQVIMHELRLIFECIREKVKWEACEILVSNAPGDIGKLTDNTLE